MCKDMSRRVIGEKADVQVNMRIPGSMKEELDSWADKMEIPTAALIRMFINRGLGEMKSYGSSISSKDNLSPYAHVWARQIKRLEKKYTDNRGHSMDDDSQYIQQQDIDILTDVIRRVVREEFKKLGSGDDDGDDAAADNPQTDDTKPDDDRSKYLWYDEDIVSSHKRS